MGTGLVRVGSVARRASSVPRPEGNRALTCFESVMRPDGLSVWVSEVEPGPTTVTVALGALRWLPHEVCSLGRRSYGGAGYGVQTPEVPGDGQQFDANPCPQYAAAIPTRQKGDAASRC
jgi:hypothetical protein